jgi:hypothetical protein
MVLPASAKISSWVQPTARLKKPEIRRQGFSKGAGRWWAFLSSTRERHEILTKLGFRPVVDGDVGAMVQPAGILKEPEIQR